MERRDPAGAQSLQGLFLLGGVYFLKLVSMEGSYGKCGDFAVKEYTAWKDNGRK